MAEGAGKLVGIDLGTTFSAIATLDEHGKPVTLQNREGETLTPSAVFLNGSHAVVGQVARDQADEAPDQVAVLVKRRMGQATFGRLVDGRDFRPETLSAIILRKLVQDAELRIGPVKKAVITVPAYFDDTRRKATKDAGRIAGLEVLDILDEPVAAALAYSFEPPPGMRDFSIANLPERNQTLLVYDLGGGTFDVTLVRLSRKRFEALAIEGDVRLGGKDWDDRIVDHVASQFLRQYGEDPRGDPKSLAVLLSAAEKAKRNLSKLPQTSITCTHAGKVLTVTLTRADFEALTRDLLTRTRLTTQQVLRQAGISWDKVDRILMVGGSTHMPMTRQMLGDISGKNPEHSLAVSEVVAKGAAIHAGIVAARSGGEDSLILDADVRDALSDIVEINVNSHSLGIEVKQHHERINDILVPKNTQLPTAASRVYRTVVENQSRVRVKVLQGEATQADACISIGECWIDGLPPNLPKGSPIQVRCGCGSDGLIDVMALDMTSGRMARTEIHRASGMSDDAIAAEAAWVAQLRIE
jgi:molecular chaperone DnaK